MDNKYFTIINLVFLLLKIYKITLSYITIHNMPHRFIFLYDNNTINAIYALQ